MPNNYILGRPKPIPPPRSQSLEGNNVQNDSQQKKINANQLAAEMSRKISLQASNIILEQPSETPPSSHSNQLYANTIGKKRLYTDKC